MSSRSIGVTKVCVEPADDVVGDAVAVLLADEDVARQLAVLGIGPQHPLEQLGGAQDVAAGLLEQVEELLLLGDEDLGQRDGPSGLPESPVARARRTLGERPAW